MPSRDPDLNALRDLLAPARQDVMKAWQVLSKNAKQLQDELQDSHERMRVKEQNLRQAINNYQRAGREKKYKETLRQYQIVRWAVSRERQRWRPIQDHLRAAINDLDHVAALFGIILIKDKPKAVAASVTSESAKQALKQLQVRGWVRFANRRQVEEFFGCLEEVGLGGEIYDAISVTRYTTVFRKGPDGGIHPGWGRWRPKGWEDGDGGGGW